MNKVAPKLDQLVSYGFRILVEPFALEVPVIEMPGGSKDKPSTGIIRVIGEKDPDAAEKLEKDDLVIFGQLAGTPMTVEGVDYLVMKQRDVLFTYGTYNLID